MNLLQDEVKIDELGLKNIIDPFEVAPLLFVYVLISLQPEPWLKIAVVLSQEGDPAAQAPFGYFPEDVVAVPAQAVSVEYIT